MAQKVTCGILNACLNKRTYVAVMTLQRTLNTLSQLLDKFCRCPLNNSEQRANFAYLLLVGAVQIWPNVKTSRDAWSPCTRYFVASVQLPQYLHFGRHDSLSRLSNLETDALQTSLPGKRLILRVPIHGVELEMVNLNHITRHNWV